MGNAPVKLLLDTHVWLWAIESPEQLGPKIRNRGNLRGGRRRGADQTGSRGPSPAASSLAPPRPGQRQRQTVFVRYRREGGQRRSPLPDFYIGAHAQTGQFPLLTRDATRYRTYFPKVKLIAPE